MPKASLSSLPISALFGVIKPSGPTSMSIVNEIKTLVSSSRLFMPSDVAAKNSASGPRKDKGKGRRKERKGLDAKIGQGGTLDPLADGVLVIGVGKGTKKLSDFLDCVKEYRTTCLLGCETDSYDSEGSQVRSAPWKHVTREKVEAALEKFRGEIEQTPPIFSALKMDGKPLYEYARSGTPLPRPIERRKVTVHSLELVDWLPSGSHSFRFPEKKFTDEERAKLARSLRGAEIGGADEEIMNEPDMKSAAADAAPEDGVEDASDGPPGFVLQMRVSGGTYVRCIAHDVGHALGSAAHVVTLTRLTQGRFTMAQKELESSSAESSEDTIPETRRCIPWEVFSRAVEKRDAGDEEDLDEEGWKPWEREVIENMEVVE
ncbi:pseudouridine synthase [Schizopora paradoxa]|uniref:tRNA pseudouridine(55) synthase n=1 Tax=Schizopora paradoxa TaxID=27342 RepID=A0A0H2S131_9AGAM|nr:pseudouridine synthase [Schizopora paradoxa]